jgi:sn-glycerol 3-phosphate transport system substrate-binding protein
LEPFEEAETDWSWDQFIPAMLARGLWEGENYAMPLARSTPFAYYNKEMFAEAGLPDRTPATWNEFREFCISLTEAPDKFGFAFSDSKSSTQWYFQATVYSQGAHISDEQCNVLVDSPETIAAVQRLADMVHKDQCAVLKGSMTDLWYNRNVGLIWSSIGSLQSRLRNADFEVGVGGLAQEPGGKVPLGGSSLWIMTDIPHEEALGAWEWLKFIAREDNQIWWLQQTGYAPFTYKAVEDLADYFAENPLYKAAVEYATQNAQRQECITIAPRSTQIFYDATQEILIAGTPVEDVLKRAADNLRADYEETYG